MPRFLHNTITLHLPCAHCNGEGQIEVKAEGHYSYHQSFVIASVIDIRTGKEIALTDDQRAQVEQYGDECFEDCRQSNIEFHQEVAQDR